MERIHADNAATVGHTPLVLLRRVAGVGAKVLAKIEGRNPAFSVKDRIGAAIVSDAEARGVLRDGMTIVEATSGNTGIALAFVAAARGYGLLLAMPETMSIERRKVLAHFGAQLLLTPGAEGMAGAVRRAEELAAKEPRRYFLARQFANPANPAAHEKTTGPELWAGTGGDIDVLVSGVGTGGTLSGAARYLKRQKPHLVAVAVEPAESPVIGQHRAGQPLQPAPHGIQGIGAGFIPETLDLSMVDRVETVTTADALAYARRLAREEGILAGISSGAAAAAAARLAADPAFTGKTIAVILPDAGERYLSTALFAEGAGA